MTYANVAAAAGSVIAVTFLVVALIILAGLIRTGQLRRNPLGTVVAIIFLVSAAHQALLVLPVVPQIALGNSTLDPVNAALAVLTALIGLMFLALKSQYGAIVLATPQRRSRRGSKDAQGARTDAVTGLPGAEAAQKFLAFLTSPAGQQVIARSSSYEYPLVKNVAPNPALPPLRSFKPNSITPAEIGTGLDARDLLREAGLI